MQTKCSYSTWSININICLSQWTLFFFSRHILRSFWWSEEYELQLLLTVKKKKKKVIGRYVSSRNAFYMKYEQAIERDNTFYRKKFTVLFIYVFSLFPVWTVLLFFLNENQTYKKLPEENKIWISYLLLENWMERYIG